MVDEELKVKEFWSDNAAVVAVSEVLLYVEIGDTSDSVANSPG